MVSSPGLTAATKSGFRRSRTPGSAWATSQSGVSITCESASWKVRPSAYGMAASASCSRPEAGAVARGAAMRAIGIDLGGSKVEGAVLDEALRPVHRVRVATERERGYEHILGRVAEVVAGLRLQAPDVRVIGIGTPGSLSARDGTLKNSNTTCLNGRPLHADLERRLGLPVRLENDANCFALAEARAGAGRGCSMVFGVILGTGVGGGIV